MKIILVKKILCFSSLFLFQVYSIPTIHVFGDSHASFCFREKEIISDYDSLQFLHEKTQHVFPIKITSYIGVTMHRIGRDSLSFLNLKHHHVKNGDIVVYVFGEVDVRCHIGKQRDQSKRSLDEVIATLASNYVNTICQNRNQFNTITSVVMSVVPPIEGEGRTSDTYPFYGTLQDRVLITQKLNAQLKTLCIQNQLIFLDIYSIFCTPQGSLNPEFADHAVHINPTYNKRIKNLLIDLIDC